MFAEELKRFIGLPVSIQIYGDLQITGRVTQVGDSYLRVVNATQSSGREYGWYERMRADEEEEEENDSSKIPELLVTINNIQAIACLTSREDLNSLDDDPWGDPFDDDDDVEVRLLDDSENDRRAKGVSVHDQTSNAERENSRSSKPGFVLEVGVGLVTTIVGSDLTDWFDRLRTQLKDELGFLIPPLAIRDNTWLGINEFRVLIDQCPVSHGTLYPPRLVAIATSTEAQRLPGLHLRDESNQTTGYWIEPDHRQIAFNAGYQVLEPLEYLITSLARICRIWADKLMSYQELHRLLAVSGDPLGEGFMELLPNTVSPTLLLQITKLLLSEQVPITSLSRIVESLAMHSYQHHQDATELAGLVRLDLGHITTAASRDDQGRVIAFELSDELVSRIASYIGTPLKPAARREMRVLGETLRTRSLQIGRVCLCVPQELRVFVRQQIKSCVPSMQVLAYEEVPIETSIVIVGTIDCPTLSSRDAPA